jgi:hypothetical protein
MMTNRTHDLIAARATELCGMLMIGDGMLAMAEPQRHILLWSSGPPVWERWMKSLVRYPTVIRVLGALEFAAGVWMCERQYEGLPCGERRMEGGAAKPTLRASGTAEREPAGTQTAPQATGRFSEMAR